MRSFLDNLTSYLGCWTFWLSFYPQKYILRDSVGEVYNVEIIFCHTLPQFRHMTSFCGQNDIILPFIWRDKSPFDPFNLLFVHKKVYIKLLIIRLLSITVKFLLSYPYPFLTYDFILWPRRQFLRFSVNLNRYMVFWPF